MWGGRFEALPASIMEEITPYIDFDKRLAAQDLAPTIRQERTRETSKSRRTALPMDE